MAGMGEAGVPFRVNSLCRGDCLAWMRGWAEQGREVDLIYLDPPFNSNAEYGVGEGKGVGFKDTWRWDGEAEERVERVCAEEGGRLGEVMRGLRLILGEGGMLAYLGYMAERVVWMRRLLRESGSLYFHCDASASHYVKAMLDGVFGAENFRNEIIWHYGGTGNARRAFPKKHDVIFFYAKGRENFYQPIMVENKRTSGWTGKDEKRADSVWQINTVYQSAERGVGEGYPTQKPLPLLERIVRASCVEGGVVLDPFCGGGTAVRAAAGLGRGFVGVDISKEAIGVSRGRLEAGGASVVVLELEG